MKRPTVSLIVAFVVLVTTLTNYGLSNAQTIHDSDPPQSPALLTVPDNLQDILPWSKEICKTYLKVKFCANVEWKDLKLKVCVKVAGLQKCWTVVDVGCYEYSIKVGSVKACISNLKIKKPKVSFKLVLTGCVDVLITKKCKTLYTQNFSVSAP